MAGVFLSYDRDDGAAAKTVATALEKAGHEVWWDLHVRGGAQFSKVIEEALKAADVVVVLWSVNSIESAWVRDEAAAGRDSSKLVPASLDGTQGPLGFRQFQTIDLSDWKRGARSRGYKEIEQALRQFVRDGSGSVPAPARSTQAQGPVRFPRWLFAIAAAGAIGAGAFLLWPSSGGATRTVTVVPASSSAMSRSLSDDLFVKLGSLHGSNERALQLVQQAKNPDLLLEVNGTREASEASATLALLDAADRSLLWSSEFRQPLSRLSDLNQQVAYGAAGILTCAADAFSVSSRILDPQTRKLYLTACGSFATGPSKDSRTLLPLFLEITRQAPRFESGWKDLLTVEDDILFSPSPYGKPPGLEAQLKRHIATARKLNPDLPEAYLAESDLLPHSDFRNRVRLLDLAVERNPNSISALGARALALLQVGRLVEGVSDARRAAQLSPFSAWTQDGYISALTYSGQFDMALEELAKAERLWPGASNITQAKYRFYLRYGSPAEAVRMSRTMETQPIHASFLRARADPRPENIEQAVRAARGQYDRVPLFISNYIQTLAAFGKINELNEVLLNWRHPDLGRYVTDVIFRPAFNDFWRDPRSMRVAAHLGLLDYWKSSGNWPDFCTDPQLPYDCKKEAAKLK